MFVDLVKNPRRHRVLPDPAEGPFSFAKASGDPWCFDDYNVLRHKKVDERLAKSPVISKTDLMEIMRWNYEGTQYRQYDLTTGSPWSTTNRTIARLNSEISSVTELRFGHASRDRTSNVVVYQHTENRSLYSMVLRDYGIPIRIHNRE